MRTARMFAPIVALGFAFAQGPVPQQPQGRQLLPQPQAHPPDFSALKSYLNLTDAQIRQMQQAREKAARDAEEKTKTLRPQIDEKHRGLADLLEKDNADATTVGKAMIEIRGLERQMSQAHEAVRNAEINVMTAEQKAKFKAIQDAAMLPQATRDAQRLGLVPGPPPGQGPGMNPPRPPMQGQPGQPMMGPGPGRQPGQRGMQPGQGPMQPPPPGPPRQGGPEGGQ